MKKIGIIGATGYTGSELVRILLQHPGVEIAFISSESYAKQTFAQIHPQYEGIFEPILHSAQDIDQFKLDLVFLALPHKVSMDYIKKWQNKPFKIVDLSGDFRLSDPKVYQHWYHKEHVMPEWLTRVPYGMPEIYADQIAESPWVANPGCYPTASVLALAPLVKAGICNLNSLVIDAKSGLTGAGIKPSPNNIFSQVNDNFKAYGITTHRHTVEIEEQVSFLAEKEVLVQFTPHLLPLDRGILASCYVQALPNLDLNTQKLRTLFSDFYENSPFVRVTSGPPEIKRVRGTNYCDVYPVYDQRTGRIVVISAIDNLVKGAAGQAVHNMNLMLGFEQTTGLNLIPLQP